MKAHFLFENIVSTQNAASQKPRLATVHSYLQTFVIVALTTLLRMGLNPLLGRRAAFIVYFPALVFSAWLGGWGSGLFALVLSTIAAVYFFIAPMHGLLITNNVDLITLVIFFLVGLSVSALSASQRKAQGQAEEALLKAEIAAQDAQRSQQALQASEQRLRLALEGGGIATWTYDLTLDRVVADEGLAPLFSVSSEDAAGGSLDVYLQAIHPEDRSRVAQTIADAVAAQDVYEAEYRVVLPEGSHRWLATRGRVVRDMLGQAVSLPGVVLDITEQVARTERERFLANLAQRAQTLTDPDAVITDAVNSVGDFLGVSRCIFAGIDIKADTCTVHPSEYRADPSPATGIALTIARDWHRPDLPSIQGIHSYSNTTEMFHELYRGPNASIIQDARTVLLSAQTKTSMEALQLRSRISVALAEDDGLIATLTAAMADSPREWTKDEASLVDAVATQLRTAVEMARVTQREHQIAEQLQRALQPPTPASVPGLALADHYRPALLEAGVGGDFSDVLGDDKGVTFLVVADLSGKGLAAASQVGTVRQMLRFALLNGRTVAGPIATLNRTLVDHRLITGFATLFASRYDAYARTLTYVNCGQDAGLVLRSSSGEIDALPTTGPFWAR